ncbi:MAG: adenylate/guanylate cyclase domain-containing protein, partial [Flavisolibacter sp.]
CMRQLAAIMFSDMLGYTALMQQNEQLANGKRLKLKEVLETSVSVHKGKILQYYGDGSLSIFSSAIDGVRAAIQIQQQLKEEPKVDVRMGMHTGDVIIDEDAIYGDGVNLASRIESLGIAGGILISEKLYDEIRNQQDILTREMGYFEFKNVKHPVRVFAIANNGIVVPRREDLKGKTKQTQNRLAVLPFVNMSADAENEYFSDGITEELLNALTRVDGLQVTSRTSVFAFKGKQTDIRDIAIQLNVDRVLEGSVRKSGNRVRITAQLINASDGYHIWSETYDRNLTDIFEIQDEISGIIANKMRENLASKTESLVKAPMKNIIAYTLYLKGLHFFYKYTPADAFKAIACLEEAITAEPDYAKAYALCAGAHAYLGATGQMIPQKAFEIVKIYSDKAIAIEGDLGTGYIAKGAYYLYYEWNWSKAFEMFQKAKEFNAGWSNTSEHLAFYYVLMGQKEKAVEEMEEAEKHDPLNVFVLQTLGNVYIFNGRYDDAIKKADKILEIHPQMRVALEMKAWASSMKGDWNKGLEIFKEVHRLTNHPLKGLMGLGCAYAKLGQREKAMECMEKMEQRQIEEPGTVIDLDLAAVSFSLGDLDKCFYHLNQCVEKRMGPVNYFLEYPAYIGIKDDPRYYELVKKMKQTAVTV